MGKSIQNGSDRWIESPAESRPRFIAVFRREKTEAFDRLQMPNGPDALIRLDIFQTCK